jgi:hypothetical protein
MEFNEEQKFTQKWLWFIIISSGLFVVILFGYGMIKQVFLGMQFGDNPASNNLLIGLFIFVFLLFCGIIWLFSTSKLITRINKLVIEYRFIPYHSKFKSISWSNVEKAEVKKYNPLLDYGGWGIRYGSSGKAFNVGGNIGLKITLKTGKQILIGTQKETELNEFLKKMKM